MHSQTFTCVILFTSASTFTFAFTITFIASIAYLIQDNRAIVDRDEAARKFNPQTRAQAASVDAERRDNGAPALDDDPIATPIDAPSSGEARKTSKELEDTAYARRLAKQGATRKGPTGRKGQKGPARAAGVALKRPAM